MEDAEKMLLADAIETAIVAEREMIVLKNMVLGLTIANMCMLVVLIFVILA